MYYYIIGMGNIFAMENVRTDKNTIISWPAVGSNVVDPKTGRVMLQMQNFIPEFCNDLSTLNKKVYIRNELIIIRSSISKHLTEVYLGWQKNTQEKATGIVSPGLILKPK